MRTRDERDNIHFNYKFKIFVISNIKRLNNKSFYRKLLLLSGDISLKPGPKSTLQRLDSNEWNVFKSKGLHIIHLNFNSFLLIINELQYIANYSNVAVMGISKSKLDESIIHSKVQIKSYDRLIPDRNINGGGDAFCIRSDTSYIQINTFLKKSKKISLKFLLPKIKSIVIGIIY